jgi:hypothetical protein
MANQEVDAIKRTDIMKRFKPIYDTIDNHRPIVKSLLLTLLNRGLLNRLLLDRVFFLTGVFFFVAGRFATTRFFAAPPSTMLFTLILKIFIC